MKADKKEFQNLTNKERAEIYADLKKHSELYFGPKYSPRRIIHTTRFNRVLKLIGDVKNKKILDAGCGEGEVALYLAAKYGYQIRAVDLLNVSIEKARKKHL